MISTTLSSGKSATVSLDDPIQDDSTPQTLPVEGNVAWRPVEPFENSDDIEGLNTELPVIALETFPPELCQLRKYVTAVSKSVQVPIDMPFMLAIAAGGVAFAKKIEVHTRGEHFEPVNLFTAVAMEPANRKSAVARHMFDPFDAYEDKQNNEIDRNNKIIESERNELEKEQKKIRQKLGKNLSDEKRQELSTRLKEIHEQLQNSRSQPLVKLSTDDSTQESLVRQLAEQNGKMAILSAEGSVYDMINGKYKKEADIVVYLQAHAGDDIKVNRVGENSYSGKIRKPALSIAVTVQPSVLQKMFRNDEMIDRGLVARFLYVFPKDSLGTRTYDTPKIPSELKDYYRNLIRTALSMKSDNDRNGESVPYIISPNEDAQNILKEFHDRVEHELSPNGEFATMRDWAGKLFGAVCRIAGILHGFQHATPGGMTNMEIDGKTARCAAAIGEYLIPHAKHAYRVANRRRKTCQLSRAVECLRTLVAENAKVFTPRDLQNKMGLKAAEEVTPVLRDLENHRYIVQVAVDREGRGRRPKALFEINPQLRSPYQHNR